MVLLRACWNLGIGHIRANDNLEGRGSGSRNKRSLDHGLKAELNNPPGWKPEVVCGVAGVLGKHDE